jgi:hypothetical protein
MWRFHTDPDPTPSVAFKMPTKNRFFMRFLLITYNHIYMDPEQDPDPYKLQIITDPGGGPKKT